MAANSQIKINAAIAGVNIAGTLAQSAGAQESVNESIAAAKTGQLTTRTNNSDGTLTMSGGHGITDADVLDLYWSGGRRYNVVVGTVATNSVPISGGSGDNLPTNLTNITAQVQNVLNVDFPGDDIVQLALRCDERGRLQFYDDTTLVLGLDLVADQPFIWDPRWFTNPLASHDITHITVTNANAVDAAALVAGWIFEP